MKTCFFLLSLFYFLGSCAPAGVAAERLNSIAPSVLPDTQRQMKTAGYWISRHPSPDELLMTPDEINALNAHIRDNKKLTKDIFNFVTQATDQDIFEQFKKLFKDFEDKGYYTADGGRSNDKYFEKMKHNMHLSALVLGVAPRYGLVVNYTDVRFFPTSEGLYTIKNDIDFDELQNSSFDVGTPVAVIHQSLDGKWLYVSGALSDGWVPAKDIAIGDKATVQAYAQQEPLVVTVVPKADIFLDQGRRQLADYVRMGTRLPMVDRQGDVVTVRVPTADRKGKLVITQGYMDALDVHEGYLPFTARNVLRQAFAMLNAPYGWGGMYGEQDCSAFLDEVFSTMGIQLPRDSKDQAVAGSILAEFDAKKQADAKMEVLKKAPAAVSLLSMKGHIMLYLGMVDGKPYAIHNAWAYRQEIDGQDTPRVTNRVIVSALSLGEGSQKGSLLRRLSGVSVIQ